MKFENRRVKITDDIYVEDGWLWSSIKIMQTYCDKCKNGESIVLSKGKDVRKLIKTLQRLNKKQ